MPPVLTRRQTLQSLATASVFASGFGGIVLSLTGCGGGGGGRPSNGGTGFRVRVTPMEAQIALPAGSTTASGALRVWSSSGTATPKSDGRVRVRVLNGGPQFTEARDAQGRLVVSGFVGEGRVALDAASTAEVLTFLAIGGQSVTSKAREVVLAGVRGLRGFVDVTKAIEAQLVASGYVSITDAALKAALDAVSEPLRAGRGVGPRPVTDGRGTIVEPVSSLSGISLDTILDDQVAITNVFLRRAIGWLDPVEYQIQSGETLTKRPAPAPDLTEKPFKIDSPKRYAGFVGTLADAITGNTPYKPVVLDPLPIPAAPKEIQGAVATTYKLTIVGPGSEPGQFFELQGDRLKAGQYLMLEAFLVDYLVPLVATVLVPMKGEEIDDFLKFVGGSGVLSDLINTIFGLAPNLWRLCAEGKNAEAFRAIWDSAPLYGSVLPLILQVFINWLETVGTDAVYDRLDRYVADASGILTLMGEFDRAIAAGELVLVGFDLRKSKFGDVFTLISTGGKVTLAAGRPLLPANLTTNVQAIIQNKNADAVYKYEWQVSAGFRLNDSFGKNTDDSPGGILTTSRETVAILAKDLKPGLASVRCKVTRIDGDTDIPISEGKGDILFTATFSMGAAQTRISKGGSVVLTAKYDGPEETEWVYTVASGIGSLNLTGRTKSKTVTLKAGDVAGPIQVLAECFVKVEGEFYSIGTTGAVVTVDTRVETSNVSGTTVSGVLVIPAGGPYGDPRRTTYEGAAVRVVEIARRPGATKYEVFRNGSLLSNSPPVVSPENPWWGKFKPADVVWARVAYSTGSTTTTYDSAQAGTDASEAAAYLNGEYGAETYELRITY